MKRKIIMIDEAKCNGCGECVSACAEGAIRIVDGKARLVKEQFCDGFGDCLGECPTGALQIAERNAPEFDPAATRTHVAQAGGPEAVRKFDAAAQRHDVSAFAGPTADKPAGMHAAGGCPGTRMRMMPASAGPTAGKPTGGAGLPAQVNPPELRQWPIQIHLVPPGAPFFKNKELVVMSTCGPLASADVHWRFLRGRSVVVACPKLDRTEGYVEKLAGILGDPSIPKVIVVRMEVPCCGGLSRISQAAVEMSGRTDLVFEEVTIGVNGDIRG